MLVQTYRGTETSCTMIRNCTMKAQVFHQTESSYAELTHYDICDITLPMVQKRTERVTDLKVMTGSVGSSSKLTMFRTISGISANSSEVKSYWGSSVENAFSPEA